MSINGEYNISVHTPAGDREAHLSLHSDGTHHLTGETCADHHCEPIEAGEVHDTHFSWTSHLPDHTVLHFEAQCEDGVCSIISGDVHVEGAGDFHFTGKRA